MHYNALHMDDQVTFRIPTELARALSRSARMRGVPKSQLVREALRAYLGQGSATPDRATILKRLDAYRGIASLDHAAIEADPIARQIYEHNWRE
jgi:hypothetical protein